MADELVHHVGATDSAGSAVTAVRRRSRPASSVLSRRSINPSGCRHASAPEGSSTVLVRRRRRCARTPIEQGCGPVGQRQHGNGVAWPRTAAAACVVDRGRRRARSPSCRVRSAARSGRADRHQAVGQREFGVPPRRWAAERTFARPIRNRLGSQQANSCSCCGFVRGPLGVDPGAGGVVGLSVAGGSDDAGTWPGVATFRRLRC